MRIHVTELGTFGDFDGDAFQLNELGSRKWGAYLGDGADAPEASEFRRALRRALHAWLGDHDRRQVEVFAAGAPIDAQDWIVDVVDGS